MDADADNEETEVTEPKKKTNEKNTRKTTNDKDSRELFVIYIDTKIIENNRKAINVIAIAGFLKKLNFNNIKEISKVGFGRTKTICRNAEETNKIANSKDLEEKTSGKIKLR